MTSQPVKPVVIGPEAAPAPPVKRARGARMAVLVGPEQGAPNFVTRRFLLAPGARIPAHRHPTIEHEQVMVRGEMVLGLDGTLHTVRRRRRDVHPGGVRALVRESRRARGRVPLRHPEHAGVRDGMARGPAGGRVPGMSAHPMRGRAR